MTAQEALQRAGIDPREARLLLAAASGEPEARIVAHPEREIEAAVQRRYDAWTARRRQGEPIAYLTGWREFYGLRLAVSPAVLIPRHETELLVERALEAIPARVAARLLDLGTGSGALALAIKQARPRAQVIAVDSSAAALVLARANAARLGLEIDARGGEWFAAVAGERFDVIVSNPPYIAEGDPHLDEGDLRFEPRAALVGGADGLEAIRTIVAKAPTHLAGGGALLLEHGYDQAGAVRDLCDRAGFESVETWRDLGGIARVTGGRVKSSLSRSTIRGFPWTCRNASRRSSAATPSCST